MPKYNLQNKKKIPLKEIKFLQVIKVIHKVRQRRHRNPPVWSHRVRDFKKNRGKKKSTLGFNGA